MGRTLVAVMIACAVLAATAFAAGGKNRVVGDCTKSQVKPTEIVLACGDGNAEVLHIHWQSFGGARAAGSGSYVYNTCTPTCVAGKFKSYSVTLTVSKPQKCFDMYDDYREMSLVFAAGAPYKTKQFELFCPTG
jgi:hypothetical protein